MYILDTDICIYLLNGKMPKAAKRLEKEPADQIGVTSITAGELRNGALHSARPKENMERVEVFLAPLTQRVFDNTASIHFASIKEALAKKGRLIGPMDLLIASIVRSSNATLVTNNIREFKRVPGLLIENWK